MDENEINEITNSLRRKAVFNILYDSVEYEWITLCRTSASLLFIKLSKNKTRLLWDLRFIEFLNHGFLAAYHFDEWIKINDSENFGSFHLSAIIICRLAEIAINPNHRDYHLAAGIISQDSIDFKVSLHSLTLHLNKIETNFDDFILDEQTFEHFIINHELAHHDFRTKKREEHLKDEYTNKVAAVIGLLKQKHNKLKGNVEKVNPDILFIYEGLDFIYGNKMLAEEVLADVLALENMLKNIRELLKVFSFAIALEMFAKSILTGIMILRLLALPEIILKAKSSEEFNDLLKTHKYLYNARALFIEGFFSIHIVENLKDKNDAETFNKHLKRINEISFKLFKITLDLENDIQQNFENGYFDGLRRAGKRFQKKYHLSEPDIKELFGEVLGWKKFLEVE